MGTTPAHPAASPPPRLLTIYYDGACLVCAAEMEHYRRLDRSGRLAFVDISAPGFVAPDHGREQRAFMKQLHVRTADGRWLTAIDAFLALWEILPGRGYRVLHRLVGWPPLRPLADAGYRLFARYRHLLPRRRCEGSCALHGTKKSGS